MAVEYLPNGVTICADTPENWAEFNRLKAQFLNQSSRQPSNRPFRQQRSRRPFIQYGYNTVSK
jgi:hypothetical protein